MRFRLACGHVTWVDPWVSWLTLIHKSCGACLRRAIEERNSDDTRS